MRPFGLVLCGGESTRMGRDKSLIDYHGRPQRGHLTDLLSPFCARVFWSINDAQFEQMTRIGQNTEHVLRDEYPQEGPLGGIITAFRKYPAVPWLIVSCDLPRLTAISIDYLLQNRNQNADATLFADPRPYPFVSIWEPAIFDALQLYWAQGLRSPVGLMGSVDVRFLTMPNPQEFLDVNDHETYQSVKKS